MASRILPLIILFVVLAILAVVGFVVYSIVQDISDKTRDKMEKKNVMFTRDGMKVGVKEVNEEDYVDRSQSILVNMWNHTSFPAYKSRLWDMAGASSSSSNGNGGDAQQRRGHTSQ
ncbi:uncharacterized protein APUU_30861S [Aspergillus puulaauensis]|uniref:Uncharacterized protein n=1 Tax=Aspergillus puulaauensis TaxID=1220207 RepID=A0A7R7XJG9_9EURO|nr:uncharacterized protein APUU_30861S [Aspergillus puulaauensis]BCS22636.1 hypothetical protein APUU_30861S [Aspergillus puulaauensis]